MQIRQYFRKRIYKWHRVSSLIISIPVLMWALSGFLYPFFNTKKPVVNNQSLPVSIIDDSKIRVPLTEVLKRSGIVEIRNFRIVLLKNNYYYQVEMLHEAQLLYFNCSDGSFLQQGDRLYAAWLAHRFLDETPGVKNNPEHLHSNPAENNFRLASFVPDPAATERTRIKEIELLRAFDKEYKETQKLLPVYKVLFERKDNIRLYIDTKSDRLANAVDDRKAWFNNFFGITHSWTFLDGWGKTKNVILGLFSFLCLFSSVLGFYIYNLAKNKKIEITNTSRFARKTHRVFGNIFLITTLLYAFSGGWHAFKQVPLQTDYSVFTGQSVFSAGELNMDWNRLNTLQSKNEKLAGISVVKINNLNYWQLAYKNKANKIEKKYVQTGTLAILPEGDLKYAGYLACRFNGKKEQTITGIKNITAFNQEYSIMNKRLPVIQVSFEDGDNSFIETSTGSLALSSGQMDRAERFSFSNLHMYHYWDMWLGKGKGQSYRNIALAATTGGLLLVAFTGIFLYLLKRYRLFNKTGQIYP